MKTGLVMEGGAMRGLFTMGVIDVFMEEGVTFDAAAGTSAGAVYGCNYKSRQPGRVLRYHLRFKDDWRFASFKSLVRTGDVFGTKFCYDDIPNRLDPFDYETFKNDPMEFYVTCTDLYTGKAVYHRCRTCDRRDLAYMRGSASMPGFSRIVKIGSKRFLDGGIADSIPVRFLQLRGCERCVVILTQPRDYVKKKNRLVPLMRRALADYPNALTALKNRHIGYNETLRYIEREEAAGRVLVIAPKEPLNIPHITHDEATMRRVYETGRQAGNEMLYRVRDFLGLSVVIN